MRKIIAFVAMAVVCVSLVGCGAEKKTEIKVDGDKKPEVKIDGESYLIMREDDILGIIG